MQGDEASPPAAASPPELSFTWQVPIAALQELFESELQAGGQGGHCQQAEYHHEQQQQLMVLPGAGCGADRRQQEEQEMPVGGPASPQQDQQQQQRWGTAGAFKAAAATASAAAVAAAAAIRRVATGGAAGSGGAAAGSGGTGAVAAGPAHSNTTGAAGAVGGATAGAGTPSVSHSQQHQCGFPGGRAGSRLAGRVRSGSPGVSMGQGHAGAAGDDGAPARGMGVLQGGSETVYKLRSPSLVFAGHAWNMVLSITRQAGQQEQQEGRDIAEGATAEGDEVEVVGTQRGGGGVRGAAEVGPQGCLEKHVGFQEVEERPSKGGKARASSRQDQQQQGVGYGREAAARTARQGGGRVGFEEIEPWVKDEPLDPAGLGCPLNMARGAMHPPAGPVAGGGRNWDERGHGAVAGSGCGSSRGGVPAAGACSGGRSGSRGGPGAFDTAAGGGVGGRMTQQCAAFAGMRAPLAAAEHSGRGVEPLDEDELQMTPPGRGSRAESRGCDGEGLGGYGFPTHAAYTAPAKLRGRRGEAAAARGSAGEVLYGVRRGGQAVAACHWVVGFALESAPAMPLRGTSAVGFSASLAAKLSAEAAAEAAAAGAQGTRGTTGRARGGQQAAGAGGRGGDVADGGRNAAAGGAGTPGGAAGRHQERAGGTGKAIAKKPTSRKATAAAAAAAAASGGGGSSRGHAVRHGQGEIGAAAGDDSDSGSSPSPVVQVLRRRRRRREAISASEGEEEDEQEESEGHAGQGRGLRGSQAAGVGHIAAVSSEMGAVAAGVAGDGDGEGWKQRGLPAGTWVKNRGSSTGFVDFFEVLLKRPGRWDAAAWQHFVQPDGKLHLRCVVKNVA